MSICELCYVETPEGDIPQDWDIVWQSLICPECQTRLAALSIRYSDAVGGMFTDKKDPREDSAKK